MGRRQSGRSVAGRSDGKRNTLLEKFNRWWRSRQPAQHRLPFASLRGWQSLESRQVLAGDVVISEFMASNDTGIRDRDVERSDWIELYNDSDESVDLTGWYLTDDLTNLDKWQFPATQLLERQRLVVFASGKNRAAAANSTRISVWMSQANNWPWSSPMV